MPEAIQHTSDFLKDIRAMGQYAFTLEQLAAGLPKPLKNITKDIDRLRQKGEVVNIRRGFYTLLPPEYIKMGMVPVDFYIDELMTYLSKRYYTGLHSAAMFHGAAHQQPQAFSVVVNSPRPRTINNQNLAIHFSEKKHFPAFGIEKKKTETGYFNLSNPELTFLDLIYFEKSSGGLNRIATTISGLADALSLSRMKEALSNTFPVSTLQRAGYMAEYVLENSRLAAIIENKLTSVATQTILLKSSGQRAGHKDPRWNIIVNTQIEPDI
jgi:predicted transcriptional regulator of viral defense system